MRGPDDEELRDGTFTVGELNQLIRAALAVTFPDEVWVEGEISGLKRHHSGHVYFQLVEADADGRADATVSVVLYEQDKRRVNHVLKRNGGSIRMNDGVHIRVRGSVDYYPAQGRLQLRMRSIDPTYTLGRINAERERLLEALRTERLLERNAALPYPRAPSHIGLITGAGSAAQADFLGELESSGFRWRVSFAAAIVQGPGAERSIVAALDQLSRARVEVIALVRGGGARTDLLAFDSEVVARAIAHLGTPVVTGIGHEIDTSIADAVAAAAYKTPTACAAGLVEHTRLAHEQAEAAWAAVGRHAQRCIDRAERDVQLAAHRATARATTHLALAHEGMNARGARALRATRARAATATRDLEASARRAGALDPARTLARGWSVTRDADGRVVRDPAAVSAGDALVTTVALGALRSTVDG